MIILLSVRMSKADDYKNYSKNPFENYYHVSYYVFCAATWEESQQLANYVK